MDVVYRPKKKKVVDEPYPPRRTWFIRNGTVVRHKGALWMMDITETYGGTIREWRRAAYDNWTKTYAIISR